MTAAEAAARILARAPAGIGLLLRARPGAARDACLAGLRSATTGVAWRSCPPSVEPERLRGGVDLPATLAAGRPVLSRGLLAEAEGGILLVPGAERLPPLVAALLGEALEAGRLGLVLLVDGSDPLAPALRDRVALELDLDAAEAPVAAEPGSSAPEAAETLAGIAAALGIASLRAPIQALRAARLLAAPAPPGWSELSMAALLALAPRTTSLPPQPDEGAPQSQAESPGEDAAEAEGAGGTGAETILAALRPSLPDGLLEGESPVVRRAASGRGSGRDAPAPHGRPAPPRPGRPGRLDLLATLKQAVPRQALRRAAPSGRVAFRSADLRIRAFRARPRRTALFVVDASGSAALHRLAEAKGAVEMLLGECYVSRAAVGLLAFRGRGTELLLPPTRALARARRCLSALPGGGGTPLAAALRDGTDLAARLRRRGESPLLVLLTDGRGNVALDGTADRPRAAAESRALALRLREAGLPALLIDIAPRPAAEAAALAAALGARYLPLPAGDAAALGRAVREAA